MENNIHKLLPHTVSRFQCFGFVVVVVFSLCI